MYSGSSTINKFEFINDIMRRRPYYASDWSHLHGAWSSQMFASSLFMFFTSLAPGLTFAMLLLRETNGLIGVTEVLLSTALGGLIFSVFAGQPLVIVGVTGPTTILTIAMVHLAKSLNISFLPFYFWIQLFGGFMHILLACSNILRHVSCVTRYCCEIFGILIGIIFLSQGIKAMSVYFVTSGGSTGSSDRTAATAAFSVGLFELVIALGTLYLSLELAKAEKQWILFNGAVRKWVSDYSSTLAIAFFTVMAYCGTASQISIERLYTPDKFSTTSNRSWLVTNTTDLPTYAVFLALVPAAIITTLFLLDHNISAIMAQAKEFNLKKPPSYHYDFLLLGVCMIITGSLGIPPVCGMIPHSFLHPRSLMTATAAGAVGHDSTSDLSHSHSGVDLLPSSASAESTATSNPILSMSTYNPGSSSKYHRAHTASSDRDSDDTMAAGFAGEDKNEGREEGVITASHHHTAYANDVEKHSPIPFHYEHSTASSNGCCHMRGRDVMETEAAATNPMFVRDGSTQDTAAAGRSAPGPVAVGVLEQRGSNFVQAALMLIMCFPPFLHALRLIPSAALDGLFLYLGIASFQDNQFFERVLYLLTDSTIRPRVWWDGEDVNCSIRSRPYLHNVSYNTIVSFTASQIALCGLIFGLTFTPADIVFPILIGLLVPIRYYIVPRYFSDSELQQLDPVHTDSSQ